MSAVFWLLSAVAYRLLPAICCLLLPVCYFLSAVFLPAANIFCSAEKRKRTYTDLDPDPQH